MEMARRASGRPLAGEFAEYAKPDTGLVAGDDAVRILAAQEQGTLALLAPLDEDRIAGLTYASGKWTLKEVVGHLVDDERIFAYRALCIARSDARPLPGFDENVYIQTAGFEQRTLEDLLGEYRSVRQASITLLAG
jgi:DinB superfamily